MDQTQQFKTDLSNFLQIIKNTTNLSEIKKEYVNLVKKYHPDTAPAGLNQKYNEYMIIINKTYSQGKTNVKEVQINEKQAETVQPAAKKVYSFKDYYGRVKEYTDYLEYIMHMGVTEYDTGRIVMVNGNFEDSYLKNSPFIPNDNSNLLEAMQHLYNASKCFNYIINNHPDYIFIEQVKEDYEKVIKLNNNLSKHIANSDCKEIL
ncbi:MAG: DnaJ domain-containing protein [Treponema sp.]|nr:DnaJ domain-containing protein [Treponema sp.]